MSKEDKDNKKNKKAEIEKGLATKEDEYLAGWKRCQADFENYKKMQAEAQKEFVKYSAQNVVMQIIPVLDNFHMSTDHVPEDQKNNAWVTGIMHIQKQLENVLKENGVTEIETKVGDKFNPEVHEAIHDSNQSSVTSPSRVDEQSSLRVEAGNREEEIGDKISKVVMKGYKLNDKIIRPVKVTVN